MLFLLSNIFVKITGFIPQLLLLRNKVYYEDKKVQNRKIKGAAIVVSNHNSVIDFAVTMFIFYSRSLRCVVAEILFEKNFFLSTFLKLMGTIRVNRNEHDFEFVEKCSSILKKGGVIEIYPEARIPRDGEERPLPFTPSTVYIALESGAPIIPVYTEKRRISLDGNASIIGKPINLRELYDDNLTEKQNIQNLTEILRGKIIELGKQLEEKKEK